MLIAQCGMNCGICAAYLRTKNKCFGCKISDVGKTEARLRCKILNCGVSGADKVEFCFQCDAFPCDKIKHLDKRYRTKYAMSMIENLLDIKELGIRKFLANEHKRWLCPRCGGTICVHKGYCLTCGKL